MGRPERALPNALAPAPWPDSASTDPIGEVARLFVLNLRAAIGPRSIRSVAAEAEISHATLLNLLAGRAWPDLATIARLERGLATDLWPGAAAATSAPPEG